MESATEANVAPPTPPEKDIGVSNEKDLGSESVPVSPKPDLFQSSGDAQTHRRFDRELALKTDLHVLLPMLFLNFFSLMGRTNIGTALIQKLPTDLKLKPMDIVVAIVLAFVPLIVLEIPSNVLMRTLEKKVGLGYIRYLSIMTALLGEF
jgi:hypothetical protein